MSTKVHIEIDEKKLRELVIAHLGDVLGNIELNPDDVRIEVKSKQNWKAEWEAAHFRAIVEKHA